MFESLGIPHEFVLFLEIMQIRDFLFSAGSFASDHSELDISRKDDGDAYWKMEIPAEANFVAGGISSTTASVSDIFNSRKRRSSFLMPYLSSVSNSSGEMASKTSSILS